MAARTIRLLSFAALYAAIVSGSSAAAATFPGRNGVLAFDAVVARTRSIQIFKISAAGKALNQLTTTTGAVWNEDPAFSPDGRWVYFSSFNRATNNPSLIYRIDANGKNRQLKDQLSAPTHVWPTINKRGSSLAVVQYGMTSSSTIATMKTNGASRKVIAGATRLQSNGSPDYAPSGRGSRTTA